MIEDYSRAPLTLLSKRKGGIPPYSLKFLILGFLFSLIFFWFDSYLENIEAAVLVDMLRFFGISAYYSFGNLFVGHALAPDGIEISVYTQGIFYVFFITLAVTTRLSAGRRTRILAYGALCYVVFIALDFTTIVFMILFNVISQTSFFASSIVIHTLAGATIIELMLYRVIRVPPRAKVSRVAKLSRLSEYIALSSAVLASIFITFFIASILQVNVNSPVNALIGIGLISNTLFYTASTAYVLSEVRIPSWAKIRRVQTPTVSFLIPAYNEEEYIGACIESIDKAAGKYNGTTEIIIINDGSMDETSSRARERISRLRYAKGIVIDRSTAGKGASLNYGLKVAIGEIIFRIDADSVIDENAIEPMVHHFNDPYVGSVSGAIYPSKERYIWQKFLAIILGRYIFLRKSQQLYDAIGVQPGAFSAFAKDVLLKLNGWSEGVLGEDRDLTLRIARLGYKNEFEEKSLVNSDIPKNLHELRKQRSRWAMGFCHSHARNLDIIKEMIGPRSLLGFPLELIAHGSLFVHFLIWGYILAALLMGNNLDFTSKGILSVFHFPVNLIIIEIVTGFLQYTILIFYLFKYKRYRLVYLLPVMKIFQIVLEFFVLEGTEILLLTSDKHRDTSKSAQQNALLHNKGE